MARRQAMRLAGLDDKTALLSTVVNDAGVRKAFGRTIQQAGQLRGEVDTSDARGELARLARDERLQRQVAGLLRAVTGVMDASVAAGKRKARRRLGRFLFAGVAVGALGYLAARQLRSDTTTKETMMSGADKMKSQFDDAKGRVEEGLGKATDDQSLENQGKADQAGAAAGQAAEKAKDAAKDLKDAAQHAFGN